MIITMQDVNLWTFGTNGVRKWEREMFYSRTLSVANIVQRRCWMNEIRLCNAVGMILTGESQNILEGTAVLLPLCNIL